MTAVSTSVTFHAKILSPPHPTPVQVGKTLCQSRPTQTPSK